MKQINLLVSALMLTVASAFANQNYDWIQPTLQIRYATDGVTEQLRAEYTYDSEGKRTGYKNYVNGALTIQYRDIQYNGRTATYWSDIYSNGNLQSSNKCKTTYYDTNWIQTTLYIQYATDGVTEQIRQEYTYDSEGKQTGYKNYSNGVLTNQYRDYQYNGRTLTYWSDTYSNGNLQSSNKWKATYGDKNWIRRTLQIQYATDGVTEQVRQEYTYDSEGREIGFKHYNNGVLASQYRDIQYNGRTATFWDDTYSGGNVYLSNKWKRIYRDATGSASVVDVLANSIFIYPNPTKGELIIENGDIKIEGVEFYNVGGKKVLSGTETKIDISQFSAGVYFVKIKTDIGELTKKVIKE